MHCLPSHISFFERGWLSSNNVLVHDDGQAILIDTGYWTHSDQTLALVRSALGAKPLTSILNTHLHSDHCGGNALLQSWFPDLNTFIPSGHAMYVDKWDETALTYAPTGQYCPQFHRTHTLNDGDSFVIANSVWRVHAAPGHDPHSIVIFNETDGVLVSADALWENGFGVVFPELEGVSAFNEVASTLKVIEDLAPKLVLPGHGSVFTDVTGALARARSRLLQFSSSPEKHASYAAKVLLKFRLLELQKCLYADLQLWAEGVSYLNILFKQYSASISFESWCFDLCKSLEKSGACAFDDIYIVNVN